MTEFEMPKARVGQPVLWYPDGDKNHPSHGLVVGTNEKSIDIDVSLYNGDYITRTLKSCVRHAEDPFLHENESIRHMYGTWEHTEDTKLIEALVAKVESMSKKVDVLQRKA